MPDRALRPRANSTHALAGRPSRMSRAGLVAQGSAPTDRELQVLQGVADGLTSKEIAGRLRITDRTANNHLQRLFTRIEARSRAHAVAIGFRSHFLK